MQLDDLDRLTAADYIPGKNPFGGIPTFGTFTSTDWETESLEGIDVAVLGIPYDNSVSNRSGCRFGPRALRASAFTSGFHHLGLGVNLLDWLDMRDVGDVYCPHGLTEASLRNARIATKAVASQAEFSVFLGGDHAITWPAALSVAETHGWGRLGMIHFDAHADAAEEMDGNYASHATPMRRLLESGALSAFEQVGLRGYWPEPAVFEYLQSKQAGWHLMDDVAARGIDTVVGDVIESINDRCDAVYLSVDIDVLDPGFAPGTGTPEPAGMEPRQLFSAVRKIALETNLVALDVMEYSPAYDHADITANNAHRVVFETLAGVAHKKRLAAGGEVQLPASRR